MSSHHAATINSPRNAAGARVFICHASEDRAWAGALCGAIEASGERCWMAPRDAGSDHARASIEALDACRVLVLAFSEAASRSDDVAREVERAAARGLAFVPVRVGVGEPASSLTRLVGRASWIDGTRPAREDRLAEVVAAVDAALNLSAITEPAGGEPVSPDRLGPYRLVSIIGEGGFGVVWLAERREPMVQRVAIKIIKAGMDSREVVGRFEQERQALALMDHPNVAKVFDAGMTPPALGSRPYFVMEHVRGEPITGFCDRHRLTIRQRLELFVPVCEGIQHAHYKGVIHRDIKPSNVMVSMVESGAGSDSAPPESGQMTASGSVVGALVKVIDFGIAKAIGQVMTDKPLHTEPGRMIGTPEYMSPEQAAAGPAGVDERTDVYSLGVLLYEMLVGAPPRDSLALRSKGYAEIQRILAEEEPPAPTRRLATMRPETAAEAAAHRRATPTELAASLRGEAEWIVLKAMSAEPGRRYQRVAELAADVRRLLAGEAILAAPPSVAYRVRKRVLRVLGLLGSAAAVWVAGVLVGLLGAGVLAPATASMGVQSMTQAVQNRFDLFDIGPDPLRHVRIVRITQRTDVPALAAREFIKEVQADSPEEARRHTLRLLHARLLDRLAAAGVGTVAFDIQFTTRSEFDAFLAQRADQRPGGAVYFAALGWGGGIWPGTTGHPHGARVGGVTVNRDAQTGNMDLELAVFKRGSAGGDTAGREHGLASLALAAYAAWLAPAEPPSVHRWDDSKIVVRARGTRSPALVPTSGIIEESERRAGLGVEAGDHVAYLPVLVPSDEDIEAACVEYAEVFAATPAQLRAWFGDRVVVVGDVTDTSDRYAYSDGRMVAGCVLQAQAIEALIRAFGWRERLWADGVLAVLGATVGLGWGLSGLGVGRRWASGLFAAVGMFGVFCAAAAGLHFLALLTNPAGAAAGMLVAMLGAGWLGLGRRAAHS